MIGNPADAALACMHPTDNFLGSGCTRVAYLINGVVYKVDTSQCSFNREEYAMAESFRMRAPYPFVVPQMSLHNVYSDNTLQMETVMAAEYIDGIETGACDLEAYGIECYDHQTCISGDYFSLLREFSPDYD